MDHTTGWAISEDVSRVVIVLTALVAVAALVTLGRELILGGTARRLTFASGALAVVLFACAVLRPVSVVSAANRVGARVVVLLDTARRTNLPGDAGNETRRAVAAQAFRALTKHFESARLRAYSFDATPPVAISGGELPKSGTDTSDLARAVDFVANEPGERPASVVLISDGRFDDPSEQANQASLTELTQKLGVPLHTVSTASVAPKDAAIRSIVAAGAAVAHQKLALSVEVACTGGLGCSEVPVALRELRDGVEPLLLAEGKATVQEGIGKIELEVTLERAGTRVIEATIAPPDGDQIPENDRRYVTFSVARDRVRLLHLAGRPTYDVRALRMWLQSDEAVDVVAFFILRGDKDSPGADASELSLIKFPVDELFVEHLPSFDAVILQDIDAVRYQLAQYLPRLTTYVLGGGGLIMVGGPSSFAGGRYAGTALDQVLPVEQPLPGAGSHTSGDADDLPSTGGDVFIPAPFVPRYTEAGRVAAITRPLRELLGEDLPEMPGTNRLGVVRPGGFALWEHPTATLPSGEKMPVLALREAGDGRSIALGVDATHQLGFGPLAETVDGRAYGALWDGLLGWLMRDPRYEAARVELALDCVQGEPARLRVTRLPGMTGDVVVRLSSLAEQAEERAVTTGAKPGQLAVDVELPELRAGGYTAKVSIGASPPSRYDFACDTGGKAFADTRPNPTLLEALAKAGGGNSVASGDVSRLPEPEAAWVSAERQVTPFLPAWVWALGASIFLGVHWFSRRSGGWA